jgi:hypothetical protein
MAGATRLELATSGVTGQQNRVGQSIMQAPLTIVPIRPFK